MKKILFFFLLLLILTACGSYKSLDLSKLTTGMTVDQVVAVMGPPDRILAANEKKEGYQEVLEYRTSRGEVYALEFWNNYLTGYEFLYDDVVYTPSLMPPPVWPAYGRPIYILPGHHHPDRPNYPDRPNRPSRPSQPNRPSRPSTSSPSRPETSRPSVSKPTESSRRNSESRSSSSAGSSRSNAVDKTKKD